MRPRGPGGAMQSDQSPSPYDRLAGVHNVATGSTTSSIGSCPRPRLNSNPAVDEAHHRVSSSGFKYLVSEMVCEAAGGPQQYAGRSMVTLTNTWASPRSSRRRSCPTCTGPCRAATCSGGAVRAGRHRGEHERGHRPRLGRAVRAITPVAADAGAAVAPPGRCHPGPLGQGSLEPARTRQPCHVGSPRRGSLGRRTQSEEG